jgi:imidazolonepropionase
MKKLFKNIKALVQVRNADDCPLRVTGKAMQNLPQIENAWLAIENGIILDYGHMDDFPGITDWNNLEVIDASGKYVLPSWNDPHTHIVFAGSREAEFVDRIHGLSYEEIAKRGGGILNSAKKLRETSEDKLFEQSLPRLTEIANVGTGAVEIKSGYGLSTDAEIKMLRVIKRLKEVSPLTIKANFLGAHAIPLEYKENRAKYIDLIVHEMIPQVKEEKLADYIDVFCDRGFFTVAETEKILQAGIAAGLRPKIHANELDFSGGVQVGVAHNALSVDHLECVGDAEINALLNTETMPTLLPSTAFFLKLHYPPARKMIDAGLGIALATDYNPGSSPSGNMPFILSLACLYLGITPEEAINAATINAAYAMGVSEELGSITRGKKANVMLTKEMNSLYFLPYSFGSNLIERNFINGQ